MRPPARTSHAQHATTRGCQHRSRKYERRLSSSHGGCATCGPLASTHDRGLDSHTPQARNDSRNSLAHDPGTYGRRREQADSYVRSWLEQTQTRAPRPDVRLNELPSSSRRPFGSTRSWRPHGLSIGDVSLAKVSRHHTRGNFSKRKRRAASRDSSVIAETVASSPRGATRNETRTAGESSDVRPKPYYERDRKRPMSHLESASSVGDDRQEDKIRFERRARYKTREDKYETNRGGRASYKVVGNGAKPPRSDRDGRHKKRKLVLDPSKDVMENLSSVAIVRERLTVCGTQTYYFNAELTIL